MEELWIRRQWQKYLCFVVFCEKNNWNNFIWSSLIPFSFNAKISANNQKRHASLHQGFPKIISCYLVRPGILALGRIGGVGDIHLQCSWNTSSEFIIFGSVYIYTKHIIMIYIFMHVHVYMLYTYVYYIYMCHYVLLRVYVSPCITKASFFQQQSRKSNLSKKHFGSNLREFLCISKYSTTWWCVIRIEKYAQVKLDHFRKFWYG